MNPKLKLNGLLLVILLSTFAVSVSAQTLAERLGYPADTKLVIVHADDLGETHAVNAATIKALEKGTINSASLMVACPWFPEIADYAKSHPDTDFGLHLTMTSERVYYRWGPVASKDKVPSLVDENGYFHHDWEHNQHANAQEVEVELRAQIERALAMGVHPTHLDSHQYRLIMSGKDVFDTVLRVAHEYELPLFVAREWFANNPYLEKSLGPNDIVIDHEVTIAPSVTPEKWNDFYIDALKNLKPGVTEFVIHPGLDDEELSAATRERPTWGSAWRQRDYDFFTSDQFREILAEQKIKLITWRELARLARTKNASGQTSAVAPSSPGDPASVERIRNVITEYATSVDNLDLNLAAQIWSSGAEVTFIEPRGTQRGLKQILDDFYNGTMGLFSKRELKPDEPSIHVYGDVAWSEFTWTFHATTRSHGKDITTSGRETQIYHRESGAWRIVHVHYSGPPETGELRGF